MKSGIEEATGTLERCFPVKYFFATILAPQALREIIKRLLFTNYKILDINECLTENPCLPTEFCINTEGSFDCRKKSCDVGYVLNGVTGNCDDIDECESGRHRCGRNTHCINTIGSFHCECNQGFRKDFYDQSFCIDVDECENSGICQQSCQNTYGGYRCYCNKGYTLNSDNRTCSDIDECKKGNHHCEKICKNAVGSYHCECPKGLKLIKKHLCDGKKRAQNFRCSESLKLCFRYQRMHSRFDYV